MREFNSLVQLKKYVPQSDQDKVVVFKHHRNIERLFYWDDMWTEKIYWKPTEAAKLLDVELGDIERVINDNAKYLNLRRNYHKIKMKYKTVLRIQFILTHSHSELSKLNHVYDNKKEYHII